MNITAESTTMSKTKMRTTSKAEEAPRENTPCEAGSTGDESKSNMARLTTSPELAAYRVIGAAEATTSVGDHIDVPTILEQLRNEAAAVHCGDLSRTESMLMNQATALQTLFARLVESSMKAGMLPQQETAMRLALKAQSQCRATLETLVAVKNPPIVYAKQANLTTGPQQINNAVAAPSRARGKKTKPTQLSGGSHELLSDARASSFACGIDPALETLGNLDRAKVRRR
ncbi:MAG: hypothetical protein KDI53_14135 [Candidatus Accumulibacter sp.]|nr:hypothetical protein [Accumulibacter sp.]